MTTTRPPRTADRPAEPPRGRGAVVVVKRLFGAETPEYFWLLGTTLFLVAFGLVMVLSSSSVTSSLNNEGDFFGDFARQALFAAIGIPIMLIAARMPATFWRRWGWRLLIGAVGLQLLVFVPGIGWGTGGNNNWIRIAGFSLQPSEFVKLALVIWMAAVITSKSALLHQWKHVLIPIGPVAGAAIGFVLVGGDLGTASIMLLMVLGALFFGAVRLRIIAAGTAIIGVVGFLFVAVSEGNRRERIEAWLSGCVNDADYDRYCWQTLHGWWALASGGPFGVGLGNSTSKWSWLPAADNDFIFAVIGEELGFVGAVVVLVLFGIMAVSFVRIARMSHDRFAKIATGTAMVWIVGQAFVNIAVVLGLLPVLGVPLPLISSGGSALVTTLAAVGVVLSFARRRTDPEPAAS
ncbi:putative lipid II flippase FtsW [Homoserinibacter sp. YIM 151385]|uniref:putative lipid II flippase FtsW n=1 Tax=Homoserinibacter sp. YIM 151385 TaxID=2985506 RepID=UPI0022F013A7|nr:putative lipid II flippase FtsW [Homoserinibacter sp. YIM 151385]WBU38740.1 putative lipid II flippase FtsW [Homoserinibacter sp. YIM 151385]